VPLAAEALEPLTLGFARRFSGAGLRSMREAWRLRRWTRDCAALFENVDVLACPTLARLPPRIGHLSTTLPFETALQRLLDFTPFTGTFNAAGVPAISVPANPGANRLPIGVQLAAAHGGEALLLELASELEAARPWTKLAPR